MMNSEQCETLRARIEAEYREMPGLSLTVAQASRLWSLDNERCAELLASLIDGGFLRCSTDGRYRHDTGGDVCHWRSRTLNANADAESARRENGRGPDTVQGWTRPDRSDRSARSTFAADPCEAFAAIIGAAARADGSVLPTETDRLEHTFNSLPMFRGRSEEERSAMMKRVVDRPLNGDGHLLSEAAKALPADLRGTAFAVGLDVLPADGRLRASELQFVEYLRQLCGCDGRLRAGCSLFSEPRTLSGMKAGEERDAKLGSDSRFSVPCRFS